MFCIYLDFISLHLDSLRSLRLIRALRTLLRLPFTENDKDFIDDKDPYTNHSMMDLYFL